MAAGHTEVTVQVGSGADPCPVRTVVERIGDKWSVLLIGRLREGPARWSELLRGVDGISRRMLAHTLRLLERDGLVRRTVHPTVPPSVEYALTELGAGLATPLDALTEWALAHRDAVAAARRAYDADAAARSATAR